MPNDVIAPGTTQAPGTGGSAGDPASGTVLGVGADGSVDPAALQAEIERLKAENERKEHQLRQHLSEKSNTEEARREAQRIIEERDAGRRRASELEQLASDMDADDPAVALRAHRRVIGMLSEEIVTTREQTRAEVERVRQMVTTRIPDSIPDEIREKAVAAFESGKHSTLKEALNSAIGEAVVAGTYVPPAVKPADPPKPPAPSPAPRLHVPLQTTTRSVLPAQPALKSEYTQSEYLAMDEGQRKQIFDAQRAGQTRITGG